MSSIESATVSSPRFSEAEAAALLASLTESDPRFASFRLEEVIQPHPNRIVARGHMDDRGVHLKLYNVPDGSERVRAARAEYRRAGRIMGRGKLRVARHVASSPRLRLIAIESVRGTRFDRVVEDAPPGEHRALHRMAADWLKRFCGPTLTPEPFDADRFLATVRGLAVEDSMPAGNGKAIAVTRGWVNVGLGADDIARRDALRAWIVAAARDAAGRPISVAATHDDFDPRNFSLTPRGALVGYDLGGLVRCPVAEAAAVFLSVQQLRQLHLPAQRRMGLAPAHVEGFIESGLLTLEDASVFLPLLVAHKWDIMFSRHAARLDWLARLRPAVDAFLAEYAR